LEEYAADVNRAIELAEAYRKTELRLRFLLFGDGVNSPGVVKGEEQRRQVTAEFRHLREVLDALIESCNEDASGDSARPVGGLAEDLQKIASLRTRSDMGTGDGLDLVTPAEAAVLLGVSPSTVYRAIRRGDIRAKTVRRGSRDTLCIASSELRRLSS
jgi:excisionase family DNA binding protein